MMCFVYTAAIRMSWRVLIYFLISSTIVTLAYVSFELFQLFDPVWVMFHHDWMLAFAIVYITIMLQENHQLRMMTMLSGAIQGEILYAIVLKKFNFLYAIGSFAFLDVAAIGVSFLLAWWGMEYLAKYFEKHINQLAREKQKLS
jgi:hypothetical protein